MSWCWHKWGKWSEPETETWSQYYSLIKVRDYLRYSQTRVCEKCGKIEKRYIK